MRILGIDYGEKRLGLAVSDESGWLALPLKTIIRNGQELKEISEIVKNRAVKKIVLGLPLKMDGSPSKMVQQVKMFGEQLTEVTNVPVDYSDERLTTKEVERRLIEFDFSRNKRQKIQDQLSACVLLQTYLEIHRNENK